MNQVAYVLKAVTESDREEGKLAALMTAADLACKEIETLEKEVEHYTSLFEKTGDEFARWKAGIQNPETITSLDLLDKFWKLEKVIGHLLDEPGWQWGDPLPPQCNWM